MVNSTLQLLARVRAVPDVPIKCSADIESRAKITAVSYRMDSATASDCRVAEAAVPRERPQGQASAEFCANVEL